jgi:hypothetical protein
MFNNIQPYKPLPVSPAQTTIRPTNCPSDNGYPQGMNSVTAIRFQSTLEFLNTTFTQNRYAQKYMCQKHPTNTNILLSVNFQPHIHRSSSIPITSALPTAVAAGCYINTTLNKSACHQRGFSGPHRVKHVINQHSSPLPIHHADITAPQRIRYS